jgi:opacity protein-like surface antigen
MNRHAAFAKPSHALAAAILAVAVLVPSSAVAEPRDDKWKFRFDLYAWLPSVGGKTTFPDASGGSDVSVNADDLLKAINGVFMGGFEAKTGRWGALTDLMYLDLNNDKSSTRSVSFSQFDIPAGASLSTDFDVSGSVWTAAGTYTVIQKPRHNLDVLGGFRYLQVDEKLNWDFSGNIGSIPLASRSGRASTDGDFWDAIVGVRGRANIGASKWFVPYYLDLGTGQSDFTWQAMAGVGYAFRPLDLVVAYRYLDWNFGSDTALEDLNFSGGLVGVAFHW